MFFKTSGVIAHFPPVAGLVTSSNLKNEDNAKPGCFVISSLI